jgi:hypothetical protein
MHAAEFLSSVATLRYYLVLKYADRRMQIEVQEECSQGLYPTEASLNHEVKRRQAAIEKLLKGSFGVSNVGKKEGFMLFFTNHVYKRPLNKATSKMQEENFSRAKQQVGGKAKASQSINSKVQAA